MLECASKTEDSHKYQLIRLNIGNILSGFPHFEFGYPESYDDFTDCAVEDAISREKNHSI
jgi:hypothetical protein